MTPVPINLAEKFALFSEHWSPKVVARMNDYDFKLVKMQGDFVWHRHTDTDETFFVLNGTLEIEFRDSVVTLNKGEMLVIPKGVEHKPFAPKVCSVLLVERIGTINTGHAAASALTAGDGEWTKPGQLGP